MVKIKGDTELLKAMAELPQPRTDYQLEKFVVGNHETPEIQYAHCVLEISVKYNSLRRAKIALEKIDYEIKQLKENEDKMSEFEWREKEIDREECDSAVLGAWRELQALYKIWNTFEKKYTREEINAAQEKYWKKRITKQANNDVMATGRVSVGNLQALDNVDLGAAPQLDHVRDIEQKYLEGNSIRVMITVPVENHISEEEQKTFQLPCLKDLIIPTGVDYKIFIVPGRSIAEAYNHIAKTLLEDGADYLLTIEDDTFPPHDAFTRLYEHIKQGKKAVGAWYPKRQEALEGAPVVLNKKGKREALEADGEVHEVYTLPMGCTLYSSEVFYKTTFPYFETTSLLTQDSFFSQKLRDAGFKLYCDTSIRCKHIDRETSKVYE